MEGQGTGKGTSGMQRVLGLVLVAGALPLLWTNEAGAVEAHEALAEVRRAVVEYPAGASAEPDPARAGALVHLSGPLHGAVLQDEDFGVKAHAVKLKRSVKMYQWQEHKRTKTVSTVTGDREETTYSYSKAWAGQAVRSEFFQQAGEREAHRNPGELPFASTAARSPAAAVGAFQLGEDLADQLDEWRELPLTTGSKEARVSTKLDRQGTLVVASSGVQVPDGYSRVGNVVQSYPKKTKPDVGDVSVRFQVIPSGAEVSVLAAQSRDGHLSDWEPPSGKGRRVGIVAMGRHSPEEMLAQVAGSNGLRAHLIRFAGICMIGLGLFLATANGLQAALGAVALGGVAIGAAWFAQQPLYLAAAVAVAIVLLVLSGLRSGKSSKEE